MTKKPEYFVKYGHCASEFICASWAEAARFIKVCIDDGTVVRGVGRRPA